MLPARPKGRLPRKLMVDVKHTVLNPEPVGPPSEKHVPIPIAKGNQVLPWMLGWEVAQPRNLKAVVRLLLPE
jgi:hypothetical protein